MAGKSSCQVPESRELVISRLKYILQAIKDVPKLQVDDVQGESVEESASFIATEGSS